MSDVIADRYNRILERVGNTAIRCGRKPEDIQLVVVTKGQSAEKIAQVIAAGATVLGENYPEETSKKISLIEKTSSKFEWHMIGHLQSRKIKYVVNEFSMIHSIDRMEIAIDLNKKLLEEGRSIPALIEANLSGEETKHGFSVWDENEWPVFVEKVKELSELTQLVFKGLMTMPPFTENPEQSRPFFKKCSNLADFCRKMTRQDDFYQLSMGTSLDFETAIEEGATLVRIGEAIMGKRNYLPKIQNSYNGTL